MSRTGASPAFSLIALRTQRNLVLVGQNWDFWCHFWIYGGKEEAGMECQRTFFFSWHILTYARYLQFEKNHPMVFENKNASRDSTPKKHLHLDNLSCDCTVTCPLGLMMSKCEEHDEEGCQGTAFYAISC